MPDSDYRLLVQSATDYAIFLLDAEGYVRTWSEGARLMKGYEPGEIIGRHFSIFYPQDRLDEGWPQKELEIAMAQGRHEDEGWRLRRDGTRFWASVVITRLVDEQGRLRGFSKITRDLTERRRQEQLIRRSEERFRLLVEGVKDYAIFMLDPSGHVVSWNAGAEKSTGYAEREIIGRHFSVFYPGDVVASGWPEKELEIAVRDGRLEDEGWRVRKDGTRYWASVVITALYNDVGRLRGFAKVTRDLTERRRITMLEDEGRRLHTFLAMLGHELRNPLAPIANALSIIDVVSNPSPLLKEARDVIGRQLSQMSRLVDDLLDVGRITSGKIVLQREMLRIAEVVNLAIESAMPLAQAKAHHVSVDVQDPDLFVVGDRARLVQVISNVLNNAAKFTPRAGDIVVTVSRRGTKGCISVKDNGPGIAPDILPRVFDLFVQGEQSVDRSLGGLGLGLSLVRQLVHQHGGEVTVRSAGVPGEGAEFLISLPLAPGRVERASGAGAPRVLVVDDNRDLADTMVTLLNAWGCSAGAAYDGIAGVAEVARSRPDLVFVDIGLPGMDGYEVARRVLEDASPPVLVSMTGYRREGEKEAAVNAGFYTHLTKPLRTEEVLRILEKVLGALPRQGAQAAPPAG